jgi:hypothetical protein
MSGCLNSSPVSMSPTRTDGLPPVIACASGAWICRISHCSENSGSSVAGLFGNAESGAPPASACSFGSCVAKPAVEEAFSTRLSCSRLSRKDVLSDRAIATPIWSYA